MKGNIFKSVAHLYQKTQTSKNPKKSEKIESVNPKKKTKQIYPITQKENIKKSNCPKEKSLSNPVITGIIRKTNSTFKMCKL